jgi:opine dehydrogenase
LAGHAVRLWGRSAECVERLAVDRAIHLSGAVEGRAELERVSADLAAVVAGAGVVLIATPANAHWDLGRALASLLAAPAVALLSPGRTGGLLEFRRALDSAKLAIAESQTTPYTCRATDFNRIDIIALKQDVKVHARDGDGAVATEQILAALPAPLRPHLTAARDMVETSIGNVGMILHCAPLLLNLGSIERPGGLKYYYEAITPGIASFLEKLDEERVGVARALGGEVETTAEWLRRTYRTDGATLFDCIRENAAYRTIEAPRSLDHRYITEDVGCGLVPLEAIGRLLELPTPLATMIIDLANNLTNIDHRKAGRGLERLGLAGRTAADLRGIFTSRSP